MDSSLISNLGSKTRKYCENITLIDYLLLKFGSTTLNFLLNEGIDYTTCNFSNVITALLYLSYEGITNLKEFECKFRYIIKHAIFTNKDLSLNIKVELPKELNNISEEFCSDEEVTKFICNIQNYIEFYPVKCCEEINLLKQKKLT